MTGHDKIFDTELLPPLSADTPLRFWDRSKHLSWLKAILVAERIREVPKILSKVRHHLDLWRLDPRNALTVRVWDELLGQGSEAVAARIVSLSPNGQLARDTMPPGVVLSEDEISACITERRRHEAEGLVVYGSDT